MSRDYARSEKGERVYENRPFNRSKNITIVGALSLSGLVASMTIPCATTKEIFLAFVTQLLVPILKPGDVVCMDNLKAHLGDDIKETIESTGAKVVYLPPYCCELNPIEECWSKLKSILRKHAPRTMKAYNQAMSEAVESITPSDAYGWFKHSGYMSGCK